MIERVAPKHSRIWYMADGVYSMFADLAPFAQLKELLDRYPQLHLYIDDSHGVSWAGRHGRGPALDALAGHPRVVVACSLNKSFASAGGAIVFPDPEMRRLVRTSGGPMIFSGPVQPPLLGAAISRPRSTSPTSFPCCRRGCASASTCSPTSRTSSACRSPRATYADPVRPARAAHRHPRRAAPPLRGRHLHEPRRVPGRADEARRCARDADAAPHARRRARAGRVAGRARPGGAGARRRRGAPAPREGHGRPGADARASPLGHRARTPTEWNALLGERGTFTVDGLRSSSVRSVASEKPEDEWEFHYYVVRNRAGKAVLATFFTAALWKDDMLSAAEVSDLVEARRADDPYYLTSTTFAMGSLLTEGDHLYLDRNADWKGALDLLMAAVSEHARRRARARSCCATCTPPTSSWPRRSASAATSRRRCRVAGLRARGRRRRGVALEADLQGARAPAQVGAPVRRRLRRRVPAPGGRAVSDEDSTTSTACTGPCRRVAAT